MLSVINKGHKSGSSSFRKQTLQELIDALEIKRQIVNRKLAKLPTPYGSGVKQSSEQGSSCVNNSSSNSSSNSDPLHKSEMTVTTIATTMKPSL